MSYTLCFRLSVKLHLEELSQDYTKGATYRIIMHTERVGQRIQSLNYYLEIHTLGKASASI